MERLDVPALTADRKWREADVVAEVQLIRWKLGPEIGPQFQRTQPNSSDLIGSIRPDSPYRSPSC